MTVAETIRWTLRWNLRRVTKMWIYEFWLWRRIGAKVVQSPRYVQEVCCADPNCLTALYILIHLLFQGMLAARGEVCLMVDADGATKFSDLDDLELKLKKAEENGYGIAVGSRSHLVGTDAVVQVGSRHLRS